jgi:hypothetical protein
MPAISFSVFKGKILLGQKRNTICRIRKAPIKAGDNLFLYWHQRSPDNELMFTTYCTKVRSLAIYHHGIRLLDPQYFMGNHPVTGDPKELNKFAQADGFVDWEHMRDWFVKQHGLPFTDAVMISWHFEEGLVDPDKTREFRNKSQ